MGPASAGWMEDEIKEVAQKGRCPVFSTRLTKEWGLRYPLVSAPMIGVSGGELAGAVSRQGGLGIIGVSPANDGAWLTEEAAKIGEGTPFGVGFIAWDLTRRPELLDTALNLGPFLVSVSFGAVNRYVGRVHERGVRLVTQVNSVEDGLRAEEAGVDAVTVQGSEAGGHTGWASMLPLLQGLVGQVRVPVIAAGGLGTAQGVAAALMGGADGVWLGTRFVACYESLLAEPAVARILEKQETDTLLTHVFDRAMRLPWSDRYPGRVLANRFTERWHADTLDSQAAEELHSALTQGNADVIPIYAGESVRFVTHRERAGDIVQQLMDGAYQWWQSRCRSLDE